MSAGWYQWLKVSKEQDNTGNPTYGVFSTKTTPVENTDFCWIRLDQNNAFTMRPNPAQFIIRSADTSNRRAQLGSAFYALPGSLNTLFYPDRAQFLLDMAGSFTSTTPVDSWSYSFEFFDTQQTWRFLGVKVAKLGISGSASDQICRLNFDLIGQQAVASPPALAAPTIANFSAATPYVMQETAGVVKLKNTVLTKYKSININITNHLGATRDELPYISACYWCGRDYDWSVSAQYAGTTLRADYDATNVQATNQIKFNRSVGPNSVTFDLKSSNYILSLQDDIPLDNAAYQAANVAVLYDRSATNDFSYSVI